jgi:MFS family permease
VGGGEEDAALVIGPLFFPAQSPAAQTLLSFMTFGLAFFARPVGALAFGHFGDRIGRKSTLVASLLLMGASTFLIAFLPTYAMAGPIAPALLCLLRFGQGFGLGGEWGGAALLAVENAPPGWRGRSGMFPQLGAPVGLIAATGWFLNAVGDLQASINGQQMLRLRRETHQRSHTVRRV